MKPEHSGPAPSAPCAHCGATASLASDNRWRPFCSERCKLLDLGEWFGGRYAIPADDAAPGSGEDPGHGERQ